MCRFLCGNKFSAPLGKYQGVSTEFYGKSMVSFVRNHYTIFQSVCTTLHSSEQCMRVPVAPHPCQDLVLSVLQILTILIRCAVVSHCWFKLHFPDDIWCGTSFHMLIWHLYIFFGKMSIKVFGPFFHQVPFLLLSLKVSLYIFSSSPLTNVSFANIFPSLWILLTLSFTRQKFLILIKYSLPIISLMDHFFGIVKRHYLWPRSSKFPPMLPYRSFYSFAFYI